MTGKETCKLKPGDKIKVTGPANIEGIYGTGDFSEWPTKWDKLIGKILEVKNIEKIRATNPVDGGSGAFAVRVITTGLLEDCSDIPLYDFEVSRAVKDWDE